jgi:hypothetical protein
MEYAFFKTLLKGEFREADKNSVELHHKSAKAFKLWMQLLHDTLDEDSYNVDMLTMWHMLAIADKYEFDPRRPEPRAWFNKWYNLKDNLKEWTKYECCCELLFPAHAFHHAVAFAKATKLLVYEGKRHNQEMRPDGFDAFYLRLDRPIIRTTSR